MEVWVDGWISAELRPELCRYLVDYEGLSQSHSTFRSNPVLIKTAVGDTHSVFRAVYGVLN